jgi:hypothetical protein
VEVEAAVAGGIRLARLVAVHEEAQGHERAGDRIGSVHPAVFDTDRIG